MESQKNESLFRKKTLERISSPEQLTDYLRVTSPGIWAVLAAAVLMLVGLFVWAMTGTLETRTDAGAIVEDKTAVVVSKEGAELEAGMPLIINSQKYMLQRTDKDDYDRTIAFAETDLPDGSYDAEVITEEIKPMEFLLKGGNE